MKGINMGYILALSELK